jgi:predicted O-methyltransferase YrrM
MKKNELLLIPESVFTDLPSPWCPHPEQYSAFDTDAGELEALECLAAIVRVVKPEFVLETGTNRGVSAMYLAEALRRNGRGRMVTLEINADYAADANELLGEYDLLDYCEVRLESSFAYQPPRCIDLLFSDAEMGNRIAEIERYRPWLAPRAWVAVHDSLKHRSVIGDLAVLDWIERIDLPTPRGLTIGRIKA